MLLCEFILNSTGPAATDAALYRTLLQLYLAEDDPAENGTDAALSVSPVARRS